jgi:hypothetical protein
VAISVEKYRGTISHFDELLRSVLRQLAQPVSDGARFSVLSPVPVYACSKRVSAKPVDKQVRRSGWRALVLVQGRAAALLDLSKDTKQHYPVSVRGANAAEAFLKVLRKADRIAKQSSVSYRLRFVVFQPLFVTALWLAGRRPLFIPTRIDAGKRPSTKSYTESQFLKLLAARDREMHPPKPRSVRD